MFVCKYINDSPRYSRAFLHVLGHPRLRAMFLQEFLKNFTLGNSSMGGRCSDYIIRIASGRTVHHERGGIKKLKTMKKCSGRDLNPGSATRKAAMLDRTVQPYFEKTATTPPEHSQTL